MNIKAYKHILNGTELDLAPAGWENVGINFIRNEFYHGISRSFVLTLRFPLKDGGGGLDIVSEYETNGINSNMTYVLQELNPQTNAYDTIFSGILDFTPDRWSIDYGDGFFEIGAIDGSKEQKFFTRDEIQFDINSLVSADGITMTNHAGPDDITFNPVNIYLNSVANGTISDSFTLTQASPTEVLDPTLTYVSNSIGDRVATLNPFYTNDTASNQIVTITLNSDYHIEYTNDGIAQKSTIVRCFIRSYTSGGSIAKQVEIGNVSINEAGSPYNGSFDGSDVFTVEPNGYINMTLEFARNTSSTFPLAQPTNDVDATLTINSLGIYEKSIGAASTTISSYHYKYAMIRLIQLATSEDTLANILDVTPYQITNFEIILTTGWNLRKYPDKPFNISIRDLFRTGDAMLFLGMYYDRINDVFKIVYKNELYDEDNVMFDLGEVSGLTVSPYKEMYFNEIEFGWNEDVEYEELQGANEFNVPCTHLLGLPVKSKMDIRTRHNGDTIGAELARRLPYETYAQQDSRYDEQIFVFESIYGTVTQGNSLTDGFQGSNEYYNTKYTPRENLKRWAKFINVPLWRESTKTTKFIKTQKNVFVEINNESELTGLTVSNLSTEPMFHPEIYEFKAPLSSANLAILNSDPHGVVQFSFRNVDYAGFILEVKGNGYRKDATWKLVKATNIDKNYLFEDGTLFNFEDGTQYEFE